MNSRIISKVSADSIEKIGHQIGNTPLWLVNNQERSQVSILAKPEWLQLGGSIKARPAYEIIKNAVLSGKLGNGRSLLDATSGNTGIAYASICAALGVPVTLCLPLNASEKRKSILTALGVNLILTSPLEGTDGAQEYAKTLALNEQDKFFYADQYNNENNIIAHYKGTAIEIWRQTKGAITHLVAGMGTTGTITGTAARLKELNPGIKIIGLQPDTPLHGLEGWKHLETAKIPGIYNENLLDEILEIDSYKVKDWLKKIALEKGWLLSPSSAANLMGAQIIATRIKKGVVVTLLPDDISKYDEILNNWL